MKRIGKFPSSIVIITKVYLREIRNDRVFLGEVAGGGSHCRRRFNAVNEARADCFDINPRPHDRARPGDVREIGERQCDL